MTPLDIQIATETVDADGESQQIATYRPVDAALASLCYHTYPLAPGQTAESYAPTAAAGLCDALESTLGARLYEPRESYEPPPPLRIYDVPGFPAAVAARYERAEAPTEFDWGLLGLQKVTTLRPVDKGDIPLMTYLSDADEAVARRAFSFVYGAEANGAVTLTVTETPGWCRNDGTWVDGPSKVQVYSGARYNDWRDSARQRIFAGLKTWLPRILVALEEAADVPAGEALSGGWLAQYHANPWALYMSSGRKELITASLTADTTDWLDSDVPEGLLEGVAAETTVRELILGALR